MTIADAYAILEHRWPDLDFKIGCDVWRHRYPKPHPHVEWVVYDSERRKHFTGATLEAAMSAAVGRPLLPVTLDSQIGGLTTLGANAGEQDVVPMRLAVFKNGEEVVRSHPPDCQGQQATKEGRE